MQELEPFIVYRELSDGDEATNLADQLEQGKIPYQMLTDGDDETGALKSFLFLLPLGRFTDADKVLDAAAADKPDSPEKRAQFIDQLSKSDLIEILDNPFGWDPRDVACARQSLEKLGVVYTNEELHAKRTASLLRIRTPEHPAPWLLPLGFMLAFGGGIIGMAFHGIGIGIGYFLWCMKTTDPTGQKYPTYDETTRNQGLFMTIFGTAAFLFWSLLRVDS
jgi:hypothetical protein